MITTKIVEPKTDKKPKVSPLIATNINKEVKNKEFYVEVDVNPKNVKAPDPYRKPDKVITTEMIGDPTDVSERLKRAEVAEQKKRAEKKLRTARARRNKKK
ncbi:MAG: hypothetical protein ACTSPV_00595 [Candidatus Hodarchaeales archaeon]